MRDKLINFISIASLIYTVMRILYEKFIHSIPLWQSLIKPDNILSFLPYAIIVISVVIQFLKSSIKSIEKRRIYWLMHLVGVAVILAGVAIAVHFRLYDYTEMTWKQFFSILALFFISTIIGAGLYRDYGDYLDSFFPSIVVCVLILGLIAGSYDVSNMSAGIEYFWEFMLFLIVWWILDTIILIIFLMAYIVLIPFKLLGFDVF